MSNNDKNRMLGVEIEYLATPVDSVPNYINEYYAGMREVNNIILPWDTEDTLGVLTNVKAILVNFSKFAHKGAYTYAWQASGGYAYNGVHIHLSGTINKNALRKSIWKLVHKYGVTPRIATSWHIKEVHSNTSFKRKRRFRPVISTSFNTTEIRLFDMEYFLNDKFLVDLAEAIDEAIKGKTIDGAMSPFGEHVFVAEDFATLLNVMDENIAPWWVCTGPLKYKSKYTKEHVDFSPMYNTEAFSGRWKGKVKPFRSMPKVTTAPIVPIVLPEVAPHEGAVEIQINTKTHFVERGKECQLHIPLLLCRWPKVLGVSLQEPNDAFHYLGVPVEIKETMIQQDKVKALFDSLVAERSN